MLKVFLAGTGQCPEVRSQCLYALDTFAGINPNKPSDHRQFEDYLLDSGAFTFMGKGAVGEKFNEYVERYADYIVRNDIKNYFEMDVDSILGYDKVLEIRKYLEKQTNRPCIPVWHAPRGRDEFLKMCDEYDYVSIGSDSSRSWLNYLPILIAEAHRRGARIHGLGFTKTKLLPKVKYDTVDSSSWCGGGRFGQVFRFTGERMELLQRQKHQMMCISSIKNLNIANGLEWVKYQKYAKENL